MADLVTLARAKQASNQATFTAGEDTQLDDLIDAVSAAVVRYCRRDFAAASFDQVVLGRGDSHLVLDQFPIVSVARVATNPQVVLCIANTDTATNQRATVATYTTLSSLDAVNALANGWSAALADFAGRASADLTYTRAPSTPAAGPPASSSTSTSSTTSPSTPSRVVLRYESPRFSLISLTRRTT